MKTLVIIVDSNGHYLKHIRFEALNHLTRLNCDESTTTRECVCERERERLHSSVLVSYST